MGFSVHFLWSFVLKIQKIKNDWKKSWSLELKKSDFTPVCILGRIFLAKCLELSVWQNLHFWHFDLNHWSFWFKAKRTWTLWFKCGKVMECLLYLGVTNVRQWLPLCKNVLVVRPLNSGSSLLKRSDLGSFPRSFQFEKWEISFFPTHFAQKVNESRSFRFNIKNKSIFDGLFKTIVFYEK